MIYLIIGWPLEIYDKMGMHPSTRCEIKADGCHISLDYQSALKPKGMASAVSFKFGEEWVPAEDLPFLERGLIKDESGKWVDKA